MKKQTFWKGSLILMLSAGMTKVLGALFKIPLTNLLGGTGMGYFSCAYGLFLPIYAVTVTGLSASVAKLTAEAVAEGRFRTARRIRFMARLLFTGLGLLLSVGLWLAAKPFVCYGTGDEQAYLSVLMIAPSAAFGCMAAVERGYYEGLQNMYPTAVSQAVEAAVKLAAGLWLSQWVMEHESAVLFLMPKGMTLTAAASAAAVLGVTVSAGVGCLYFMIRNLFGDGIRRQQMAASPPPNTCRSTMKALLLVMMPIALGAVATNLTTVIDLCTIMRCVVQAQEQSPTALTERFGEIATTGDFPAYLYGIFTGMALTVFNLVPSVTNMFGRSILPCAAMAWTKGHRMAICSQVRSVVMASGLLALPAFGGLWLLAKPVMAVLYGGDTPETTAAAAALRSLLPAMVCLCLVTPLFSMMQGIGRADLPVKLMLMGVAVKLLGNLLLIPQSMLVETGAGYATSLCYGTVLVAAVICLRRIVGQRLMLWKTLLPVIYASGMSMGMAYLLVSMTGRYGQRVMLPVTVAGAALMYGAVLWLMGRTRESLRETLSMPV